MYILRLIDEIHKELIYIHNSTDPEEIIIDSFEITKECLDYIKSKDLIFIKLLIELIKSYIIINQEKTLALIISELHKYSGFDKTFIDYIESNMDATINSSDDLDDLISDEEELDDTEELDDVEEYIDIEDSKLNKNQIEAINNMIKQDFKSGIVNQSVGAGKSFIMLNGINEHYKKYNCNGSLYIVTCPRKEVIKKMFYSTIKNKDGKEILILSPENIKKWNKFNVIDINKFNIIERVETKKQSIPLDINKPNILVVNTDYLKTLHYKKIINYKLVNFIMFDECHGVSANIFYNVLADIKYNKGINIIGFSATPLRDKAEDNVKSIFCKSMDQNRNQYVNIISTYDVMDAIKDNIILPPSITIMEINKTCNKKIGKNNKGLTKNMINKILPVLPYKKIIGWCGTIIRMKEWYKFFTKEFPQLTVFCSTSQDKYHNDMNTNFEGNKKSFYEMKSNCILLVVNRCREGSDIPNVDCGIYLDMVKKRGILVAIQTSGRVLRHDDEHKKTVGNIIDTFINQGKIEIEIMTAGMLINYYERVLNLSNEDNDDTMQKYSMMRQIFSETTFDEEKNQITVKIDDTHNTIINLELTTQNFDWSKFKEKMEEIIAKKNKINMIDRYKRDFTELKDKIKGMFINKDDYKLYASENDLIINPDEIYIQYGWTNWYDFLGTDISIYPKTLDELKIKIKDFKFRTFKQYLRMAGEHTLPYMLEDLYKEYTTFEELLQ
jgi:superfamily II DNA or RNA helicase